MMVLAVMELLDCRMVPVIKSSWFSRTRWYRKDEASSSRGEWASLIALAVVGAIWMAVEPIVIICSHDFHLRPAVIHFLNMLCYLLLAWYGLPNVSDENIPLSVVNIIRAAVEVAVLTYHMYKTPSRKDVADILMISTIGSLGFYSCFYFIEKNLSVDGKRVAFGYAAVGFSAILMIPPILDMRREMVENPNCIGFKDACRIGGGCAASIIWMLYGLSTSSLDYPTIVGGIVGIIGAVLQFIIFMTIRVEEREPTNLENHPNEESEPTNHENHSNEESEPTNLEDHPNEESEPTNLENHPNEESEPTNLESPAIRVMVEESEPANLEDPEIRVMVEESEPANLEDPEIRVMVEESEPANLEDPEIRVMVEESEPPNLEDPEIRVMVEENRGSASNDRVCQVSDC